MVDEELVKHVAKVARLELTDEEIKKFVPQLKEIIEAEDEAVEIPAEVQSILDERKQARADKDFAKSDELRDKLAGMGYVVKDTSGGQEVSKA